MLHVDRFNRFENPPSLRYNPAWPAPMLIDSILPNHQPAPAFSLSDLDGKIHSLADYRGQITILNFWSAEYSWSAHHDAELIPRLSKWNQTIALLPIASNSTFVANLYLAQTTPHFFVIDRDGILRYQGAFDDITFRQRTATRHFLAEAVEALLKGLTPEPDYTPAYGCTIVRHLP